MITDRKFLEEHGWTFLRTTQVGGAKSSTFANLWTKPGYGVMTQWKAVQIEKEAKREAKEGTQ